MKPHRTCQASITSASAHAAAQLAAARNDFAPTSRSATTNAGPATLALLAASCSALAPDAPTRELLHDLPMVGPIAPSAALLDAIVRVRDHAPRDASPNFALANALEQIYEALLLHDASASGSTRARLGAVYTPRPLALSLTRTAWSCLAPARPRHVLDPACGSGRFLLACLDVAAAARAPLPLLHGFDIDPCAVFLARLLLCTHPRLAADDAPSIAARIRCCDALAQSPTYPFDLVLGNPPFLNQLERASARAAVQAQQLHAATDGIIKGYADTASAFLHRAVSLTRPGGVTCMIQPLSVLAARDSRPLRAWCSATADLQSIWVGDTHAFAASVFACALTLRKRDPDARLNTSPPATSTNISVTLSRGVPPRTTARVRASRSTRWSALAARACDVPNLTLDPNLPTLRDWLDATADFRDVYYALRDLITDAPPTHDSTQIPILNTGLIELAATNWGRVPARLYRQRWVRPAFDLARAQQHPFLARVLPLRLRPKLILATQTRVIEAFVDAQGAWMPTTPLISLTPRADAPDPFTIAAALCSPVATLVAARRTFGTSMSPRAIKLAAREVLDLPIPRDAGSLVPAAAAFRAAASAHANADHAGYAAAIDAYSRDATAAYALAPSDLNRVLDWWRSRHAATTRRASRSATP